MQQCLRDHRRHCLGCEA